MNRRQKLVQEEFLNQEDIVIKRLGHVYDQALKDLNGNIENLQLTIDGLKLQYDWMDVDDPAKEQIKSMIQSKIYQKKYQEALQTQVSGILDEMKVKQFTTISDYLDGCYNDGFIGTVFDLHGQGIPFIMPINQEAMVRAVQLDSKISKGLYTRLGEDIDLLKRKILGQVSRSISTGTSYAEAAKHLANYTRIGYNNAIRITRTEGHRIQTTAAMDALENAKDRGADVVKQWDSTLDKRTRESHQHVDGEIRELDEPFSNGLMFPGDPDGAAAEVINCRCALLQRAKWALDEDELETLKKRAEYYGLDKTKDFDDFKSKYLKAVEVEVKDIPVDGVEDVVEDVIKVEKLDISNLPGAFASKTEKKNTEKFIEYVNGLEGANPDTVMLYNRMGKLESVESMGLPFKITHGKNHAVRTSVHIDGRLHDVQLVIPKLSGDDLAGQINTILHEEMHLMDLYCRQYKREAGNWFSESRPELVTVFKNTTADISDDVSKLFKEHDEEYKKVCDALSAARTQKRNALRDEYFPDGKFWSDFERYRVYEKELKKIDKWYDEERDYQCRNLMGGGVGDFQDIYDALSGGKFRDNGTVIYGHGSKYYRSMDARINETIANYGALSVTRPDLIELLRQDKPDLVAELEATVKEMLKKAGD